MSSLVSPSLFHMGSFLLIYLFFLLHPLHRSCQGFMHMKFTQCKDGKYVLGQNSPPFGTIPEVIHFYTTHKLPIRGAEHLSLLFPVLVQTLWLTWALFLRFIEIRHLNHECLTGATCRVQVGLDYFWWLNMWEDNALTHHCCCTCAKCLQHPEGSIHMKYNTWTVGTFAVTAFPLICSLTQESYGNFRSSIILSQRTEMQRMLAELLRLNYCSFTKTPHQHWYKK